MTSILFLSFLILILVNQPIAFALGISSVLYLICSGSASLTVVVQSMFKAADSFPLMAIPFFMLAGNLMEKGGVSRRIIDFAFALVGHIRGGLAMVCVLASMLFAGISGSAVADTAAVGSVLYPEMVRKKYSERFAVSLLACAGSIGVIIPPSNPMVLMGVIAGVSIAGLFLGGVVPGMLIGLSLMAASYFHARKHGYESEPWAGWKKIFMSFVSSFPALLTVVIIMGGILGGIFTATEASVAAVVYALLVGFFVYRELKLKDLPEILVQSATTTAMVMFLVATASIFGWILASEQIPQAVSEALFSISKNKIVILIIMNLLLLFVGTFMDLTPALIILVPVLQPVAKKIGMNDIHFGVMVVVNLTIGLVTPPVGNVLFVACSIGKKSITDVFKTLIPLLALMVAVLFAIAFAPGLVLFVPGLFLR